ncbi:MAG: beta-N-acetylhexosaminidase, partial [Thermoflexales bacterium]|nr:beta-N-acetylhexosaminidase [Thermoflexales bacterium]
PTPSTMNMPIPQPVLIQPATGAFTLNADTRLYVDPPSAEMLAIGEYRATKLRASTGYALAVLPKPDRMGGNHIVLSVTDGDLALGAERYELTITPDQVTLNAVQPVGLFRGVQTIRQLLPPDIERASVQDGPWQIPAGMIKDRPRFAWRGAMLDVARHFFSVDDVKRYIDLLAYYKLNRFHLHLTDDQGWRIEIKSWPKLATYGGTTAVDGAPGGYYTQAEYADLVAYAQARYITLVPEIDLPGHTNAALASYPELNCDGKAPVLYTGIEVGFSSLCIDKEITYQFLDDVIGELAALTPGAYLHIGGDEAKSTPPDQYVRFIERVQPIVAKHGKQVIGWAEIARAELLPTSIAQYWDGDVIADALKQHAPIIMSPASKAYLDMKYDAATKLGLKWAGLIDVATAYTWDPVAFASGVAENDVLGIEAPLWSETLLTISDIEYLAFPRLPGYAEIAWSPQAGRAWEDYRVRLAAHGAYLSALGVNFYRAPEIDWQP